MSSKHQVWAPLTACLFAACSSQAPASDPASRTSSGGFTAGTGGVTGSGGSAGQTPATEPADLPEPKPDAGAAPPDVPMSADILMVLGDSNGTTMPGELSPGDAFTKHRLESVLGHRVATVEDTLGQTQMVSEALQADLILVAESVASANLRDKLRTVTTPVLNFEAFIQDEMGLTAAGPPGDPGEPDQFALGVKAGETRIDIVDDEHVLAAGLTGTIVVYQAPRSVTWGTVAATAEVVATLPADPAGATIYAYRKGARLFDGSNASGLRVGFFLEDENETGTPNVLTEYGLQLFDAAVAFALTAQ